MPFRFMKLPEDGVLIRDMVDYAARAVDAVGDRDRSQLDSDPLLAAALERFIEVIGEAASKVSPATREAMPDVPWREIVGMRNRLVHGYAAVDHDILWDVASVDLPDLLSRLREFLEE